MGLPARCGGDPSPRPAPQLRSGARHVSGRLFRTPLSGRTTRSSIFEGVRVYFNGAFSVRMDTLHGMVVENGGEVTLWKHDSAGRPTHYCTAGLTPSQIAEVK